MLAAAQTSAPNQWIPVLLILGGLVFVMFWIKNWWTVADGGEDLEHRLEGLRGNMLDAYRAGIRRGLDRFARFVGDHPEELYRARRIRELRDVGIDWGEPYIQNSPGGNRPLLSFSAAGFWFCAGLAVFYPLFCLLINWTAGGSGSLGEMAILPAGKPFLARLGVLLAMALPFPVMLHSSPGLMEVLMNVLIEEKGKFFLVGAAVAVAIAIAVAFAVAVAGVVAGVVAGAFAAAGLFAGLLTQVTRPDINFDLVARVGAAAVAVAVFTACVVAGFGALANTDPFEAATAVFVAFIFAVAGPIAGSALSKCSDHNGWGWLLAPLMALFLVIPVLALAWTAGSGKITPLDHVQGIPTLKASGFMAGPVVLFLGLLPALNAPLDWTSLGVTRWISGLISKPPKAVLLFLDLPLVGWVSHLVLLGINFLITALIASGVVFATVLGVSVFSGVHVMAGGHALYDVPGIIAHLRVQPFDPQFLWIYAMMGWTLVPTLIHSMAWAGAWVYSAVSFRSLGDGWARWIESAHSSGSWLNQAAVGLTLSIIDLLPGLGLIYLIYDSGPKVLAYLTPWSLESLGGFLLDGAERLAWWIQSWMHK